MIFFGVPLGTKPAGIQKTLTSWVGCMDRWMGDGQTAGLGAWTDGWGMDRRLDGCMDRWMGRWTDGWVGEWGLRHLTE